MYGKVADVWYKDKEYQVFVTCTFRDTPEDLSRMGLYRLTNALLENPELAVDEVVDLINEGKL